MISRNPRKCLKFVLCTLYSSALDQPRKLKVTSKENLKSLKKIVSLLSHLSYSAQ